MNPWKKQLLGAYYFGTLPFRQLWSARRARHGRAPAIALFYHRVADSHPNDWTISNAQFAGQITWLSKRFEFVSLAETQRRMVSKFNDRPSVCITFDDGYGDNCDYALPLLLRNKIPITYFVSTNQVLNGRPFPHDVARGQPLKPNCLEQLRWMLSQGVEIGAHTRSHADLGQVDNVATLIDEMVTARDELQDAIGGLVSYFAFPYGHPRNMPNQAFALARQAGYRGVVSAYGGYNFPGDDPFHVQRIHGDPEVIRLKNWTTLDPRKLATVRRVDTQADCHTQVEATCV